MAVFSREKYVEAGEEHTKNDAEVGLETLKESQSEVNGHAAMLLKICKVGKYWNHIERIRETMLGKIYPPAQYDSFLRTTKGGIMKVERNLPLDMLQEVTEASIYT